MSSTAPTGPRRQPSHVVQPASRVRWFIAIACAIGLAINYIDRSAISVALPFMTEDLPLSPAQQGLILSAFSWSYALMQIPAGRLIDRFGERLMFGASVLVWSRLHRADRVRHQLRRAHGPAARPGRRRGRRLPVVGQDRLPLVPRPASARGPPPSTTPAPASAARSRPRHRDHHRGVGLAGGVPHRLRARRPVDRRLVGAVPAPRDVSAGSTPTELAVINEDRGPRLDRRQGEADAARAAPALPHGVGHDARLLLRQLHGHVLPHLVPVLPGQRARLRPAQARHLRLHPAHRGDPRLWIGGLDRRLPARARLDASPASARPAWSPACCSAR